MRLASLVAEVRIKRVKVFPTFIVSPLTPTPLKHIQALLLLVLPVLSISFFVVSSTSVYASAPFLILIDIIFAVIWPSLISMISRSRPSKKQAKDISSLVVGGRAGMTIMFGLGGEKTVE